ALLLASKWQHLGTMAKLRDAGVVDNGGALITAASYDREESVKFLLRQKWAMGAHQDAYVNYGDKDGRTALFTAVVSESPRIVRMLLDAGARCDSPGSGLLKGATALGLTLRKLELMSPEEDRAKDRRRRLEGLRRLLLQVDAIYAVSWLWPSD
ncbi:unnamed protein product, partial [Hapterophycus canaliculatus]